MMKALTLGVAGGTCAFECFESVLSGALLGSGISGAMGLWVFARKNAESRNVGAANDNAVQERSTKQELRRLGIV